MYRRTSIVGIATAVVLGTVACASHSANQQALSRLLPEQLQWTGSIRPVEHSSGAVEPSKRTAMNGTVRMVQDPGNRDHSRIDVTLSSPRGNTTMSWALVSSRCGSAGLPVLPLTSFQPLDLGSSGRGETSVSIPFSFPTQGSYHVAVYSGNRASLNDVIACAQLKLDQK
jgi:hypothetical protein